jgi:AhpD family alkylhydroperoxidase
MSRSDRSVVTAESAHFADLTEALVPKAAGPLLAQARAVFGFVPNLALAMALEPAALDSYFHALQAFGKTSLSPVEQQIVLMAVSRANRARYSLAIHATLAAKLGAPADLIKAVGTGTGIDDPRIAALHRFTDILTVARGQVAAAEVDAFFAAGYDSTAVVAVAFGVAVKTFANALALLAETPVDQTFAPALAKIDDGMRGDA